MNRIITVGREFGSGGREFARCLAETLGFAYYDREIISEIAKRTSLSEKYVQNVAEHKPIIPFPIHTGRTFWAVLPDYNQDIQREQHGIIRELAGKSDCVIVGRGADYILREQKPYRIFVYSDSEAKLRRCRENSSSYYEEEKDITDKELSSRIEHINASRSEYYEFYTGQKWGEKSNYDLCINTSSCNDLLKLAKAASMII